MSIFDDKFAAKNAAQSRAWSMMEHDKKAREPHKPAAPKMGVCDKCHKEALVKPFRSRQTEHMDGVASYGTVVRYYCEECAPKSRAQKEAEVPAMTNKQVKNLMRSAKKGLL